MPEIKALSLTTVTGENMSRHEMLQWVNSTLSAKYSKIEELCSGVAYCQLMEMLFPNCIGMRKVKTTAKLEHDFAFNLKLFQGAFLKLNFDKSVPIDKLIKGRFQDNFEFLQWFKKFYDMHSGGRENHKSPNTLTVIKPIRKAISASNLKVTGNSGGTAKKTTPTSAPTANSMRAKSSSTSHLTPRTSQTTRSISPASLEVLTENAKQLKEKCGEVEQERDYFFNKLQQVEKLCIDSESKNEHVDWVKKVLTVLYDNQVDPASS